jgi:hypothetical protein
MTPLAHIRPAPRITFKAWRTDSSIGGVQPGCNPIALNDPQTLAEAVMQALPPVHKATFVIHQHDAVTGRGTLHVYYVKQSTKGRQYRDGAGHWRIEKPLVAELVAEFPVAEFAPVEVWRLSRATPDFSGIDRGLVEARP